MTTMRRRLLALGLSSMLLAAACGGGDGGDDEAGGGGDDGGVDASLCPVAALEEATEPVAIDFWFSGLKAANVDGLKELVDAYNGSQEKVRVTAQFQGSYEEGSDKYITSLRGGDLPNMILLEETAFQLMIDSESMVPAAACAEADDYSFDDHLPVVLDQFEFEDELWPMPFNVSNPVLYFDTNDFEAAGLDPEDPPDTFEEMLAAARAIKESGAAGTGFAWEMSPWYIEQFFAKGGETIVNNGNGREERATAATLEGEVGLDIYEFIEQLFAEGLAVNVGRNESGTDTLLALGKGDAAMAIGTSAALGSIYEIQAAGQFTDVGVGVGPLPGPGGEEGGVQVGGGSLWIVGKDKSDAEIAATWDFAKWLNEAEQQATWHARTGYIPVRESAIELPAVADLWKETPTYRVAYDQLLASEAAGGPSIGAYREFRDALRDSLESLVLKNTPAAKALEEGQQATTEAIESYNERIGG